MQKGDLCPECTKGKVYHEKSLETHKSFIRIEGNPLFEAVQYEQEILRCNCCKKYHKAKLPDGVDDSKRYTSSAITTAGISRYIFGTPHYRIESIQRNISCFISTSSMFEMSQTLMDAIYPVYERLIQVASDSDVLKIDDSRMKVMSYVLGLEGSKKYTCISAIVAKSDFGNINLYKTNETSAGKFMDEVLNHRNKDGPVVRMSDALGANNSKNNDIIFAKCLVHARRGFFEILQFFQNECKTMIEYFSHIWKNERHCDDLSLSTEKRLSYHQKNSGPFMEKIYSYAKKLLDSREVEPNSSIGKACKYLLRHWEGLTMFLRYGEAPIDNNECERLIKKAIIHRKNSLFYKSDMGATVGDTIMSVGFTGLEHGVQIYNWFETMLINYSDVFANPDQYLPWNFKINN